jgi:hypothetical protein
MDPSSIQILAAQAVSLLVPYLSKAAESLAPRLTEDLYSVIKKRFEGKPAAQESLAELENAPEEADLQASVRAQLKKLLSEDESFQRELAALVTQPESEQALQKISASGRGVAAGGAISGTVITGDVSGSVSIGNRNAANSTEKSGQPGQN